MQKPARTAFFVGAGEHRGSNRVFLADTLVLTGAGDPGVARAAGFEMRDMKPTALPIGRLLLLCAALVLAVPTWAQDRVYRCGNEYTNQPKGRTDCKPVEGGNLTIVRGTRPAAAASGSTAARAGGAAPASAPRVADAEQRKRDADARAILEQELRRAEARQAELEQEYKGGQPDKIGGEARNYQKYLDRVAELKASIERNQADIEGIKRELDRLPPP